MKKRNLWLFGALGLLMMIFLVGIIFAIVSAVKIQKNYSVKPDYSADELYTRALSQEQTGDWKEAETYLEQALVKNGEMSYRHQLAVVKYRLGKYQESIDQYNQLIASNVDLGFAWNGIGNAYRDWSASMKDNTILAGQYFDKAKEAYLSAISTDPGYVSSYSNLGMMLADKGMKDEAISVLAQGVSRTSSEELARVKASIEQGNL